MPTHKKKSFPGYIFDARTETTKSFRKRWAKCNNKGSQSKDKVRKPKLPHSMPTQLSWAVRYPWTRW